jgi:hypothetical protein
MSNISIAQALEIIVAQCGEKSAKEGADYAESIGYNGADEFFSLAMSKILYSADQLETGARFAVEPGSLENLI